MDLNRSDACLRFSPQIKICGGPYTESRLLATQTKKPARKLASESGGYLLSHNMQYHRRC